MQSAGPLPVSGIVAEGLVHVLKAFFNKCSEKKVDMQVHNSIHIECMHPIVHVHFDWRKQHIQAPIKQ
jgi:hypothetical protein